MVRRNPLFVLDFCFKVVDSVVRLNGERYGLVGEGLDKKGSLLSEVGLDWLSSKQRTELLALA